MIAAQPEETERRQRVLKLQRERGALYRQRRSLGARCVAVELLGTEVERLIAFGSLEASERASRVAITEALHARLDRTLGADLISAHPNGLSKCR
jgi:hypothetical protein